jgi:hypothetical protein
MRRGLRLAFVVLFCTALFVAPAAHASRRSGLAGNLLIEDVKDIFLFPHDVARYVNHVWFDFISGGAPAPVDDGPAVARAVSFWQRQHPRLRLGYRRSPLRLSRRHERRPGTSPLGFGLGDYFQLLRNQAYEDGDGIYDQVGARGGAVPPTP